MRYQQKSRTAFTLVELLVSLVIVSILAALTLSGLATVRRVAKEDATRTTIRKIHEIIVPMYEGYLDKRVPATGAGRLANIRMLLVREMPDVLDDVCSTAAEVSALPTFLQTGTVRAYQAFRQGTSGWNNAHEAAECLYLIVTRSGFQPDAMEHFRSTEIGDVDGDGAPEFLDAWGGPIRFRRWAPGFVSIIQPSPPTEHDPFDFNNADAAAFALQPLIFSDGLDKSFSVTKLESIGWRSLDLGIGGDLYSYDSATARAGVQPIGYELDPTKNYDNITNHDLVTR